MWIETREAGAFADELVESLGAPVPAVVLDAAEAFMARAETLGGLSGGAGFAASVAVAAAAVEALVPGLLATGCDGTVA